MYAQIQSAKVTFHCRHISVFSRDLNLAGAQDLTSHVCV